MFSRLGAVAAAHSIRSADTRVPSAHRTWEAWLPVTVFFTVSFLWGTSHAFKYHLRHVQASVSSAGPCTAHQGPQMPRLRPKLLTAPPLGSPSRAMAIPSFPPQGPPSSRSPSCLFSLPRNLISCASQTISATRTVTAPTAASRSRVGHLVPHLWYRRHTSAGHLFSCSPHRAAPSSNESH